MDKLRRLIDIIISLLVLIILFPFFVLIAVLIVILDGTPIFYIQKRVGKDGKLIKIIKFRTMKQNSEKILENFLKENPSLAKEWKKYRKLKKDPRVTKIGKFLRKYSLDELPQFINVLKGDMTLIGPRPYIVEELKEANISEKELNKLLSVKPGITGLWQVEKRNNSSLRGRVKIDLLYIKRKNFLLDLKILLKTLVVIVKGKGV